MASTAHGYQDLLTKHRPAVIHTKAEHRQYLAELERLFHKASLTDAEQRYAELLGVLVEDYEKRAFPLKSKADPIDVLKELMAANRLQQKDLLDVFKHKTLLSEILSRKRPLSVEHIRGLARRFRVSAGVFI
ncbi:MAG TPA: transcriptional regulator [Candidatus Binatia bacterium]|nr:transcriptional regulator [Candidatus Binatia bacterium]